MPTAHVAPPTTGITPGTLTTETQFKYPTPGEKAQIDSLLASDLREDRTKGQLLIERNNFEKNLFISKKQN